MMRMESIPIQAMLKLIWLKIGFATRKKATRVQIKTAKPPDTRWRPLEVRRTRCCPPRTSRMARMNMLKALEPKKFPADSSGEPIRMELMEVSSSGRLVAPAKRSTPINIPPSLVRAAITSPYLASCIAEKTIKAADTTKVTHTHPPDVAAIWNCSNIVLFCLVVLVQSYCVSGWPVSENAGIGFMEITDQTLCFRKAV